METVTPKARLAIVCPFINLPHYILKMVETIETEIPYVIILIDNNSTPETYKELEGLRSKNNVIYLKQDRNIGVAPAWNRGCEVAFDKMGIEYVLLANNDILYHPKCIDTMVSVIKNPKYALVSAMDVAKECDVPEDILKMEVKNKPYEVDEPEFSCFMIKRETWHDVGRFDDNFYPAYFEDNDYHYRIRLAGLRGVKTSTALYYHYGSRTIREQPDMESVVNALYLQNEAYFKEKWGGKPGQETYKTPFGKTLV